MTDAEPTLLTLARQHPKGQLVIELAEHLQKRDGTAPHVAYQIALALADTVDFFPETTHVPKGKGKGLKRRTLLAHVAEIDRALEEQPSSMAARIAAIRDLKVTFDDQVDREHELTEVDRALGLQVTGDVVLTRSERIRALNDEVGKMTDAARTAEAHAQEWQRKAEMAEVDMKRNLQAAEKWKQVGASVGALVHQLSIDVGMDVDLARADAKQIAALAVTVRKNLRTPPPAERFLELLQQQVHGLDVALGIIPTTMAIDAKLGERSDLRMAEIARRDAVATQLRQDIARVSADRAHLEDLYHRAMEWLVSVDEAIGVPVSLSLVEADAQTRERARRTALVRTQALGVWLSNLARNLEMEIPDEAPAFTVFLATLAQMITAGDPDEQAALRTSLAEAREKLARIVGALA